MAYNFVRTTGYTVFKCIITMIKRRLDQELVRQKLVTTRSQAESFIKLGEVTVDGKVIKKSGYYVSEITDVKVNAHERYVSRAGLKLASVVDTFSVDFKDQIVLDVGSSTGGFTDYALQHAAKQVIAVEVGKDQLHPKLRSDKRIELHEQTDIRNISVLSQQLDLVVIDVSFISLKDILPHVATLCNLKTQIIAMLKPQFEAPSGVKHKGIIKNERLRRDIIKNFEQWLKDLFVIKNKADSKIAGAKGNVERFYLLVPKK